MSMGFVAYTATLSFDRLRTTVSIRRPQALAWFQNVGSLLLCCLQQLIVVLSLAILAATLMNVKKLEEHHLASDYIPGKYLSFTAG
jgi:hypothetical protein